MQKLALQEKIPSEKRRYCVPGTMKSFKVQTPLEVEDKIDEIVESLSINRFREFNPVLGISRIKDSEVHITDDMEHVDNIEEEEGVVFYLMLLPRDRRRSEEDVLIVRGSSNFPQTSVRTPRQSRSTPNSPAKTQAKAPLQRSRSATDPLMRTLDPFCCHEKYNTRKTRTRRLKCSHTR